MPSSAGWWGRWPSPGQSGGRRTRAQVPSVKVSLIPRGYPPVVAGHTPDGGCVREGVRDNLASGTAQCGDLGAQLPDGLGLVGDPAGRLHEVVSSSEERLA